MVTNVGIDNGHPYIEAGADEGEVSFVGSRVSVTRTAARAVAFTLERSVNDGVDWETVLGDVITGDGANLVDWESLSNGTTQYKAVAFTVEGATAETIVTVNADSDALWISGGQAYGTTGRLPFDPGITITAGRERAVKQYAGRSLPVALVGEALARTVAFSGETSDLEDDTASSARLQQITQAPEPLFLFRDPDGNRIYGMLDTVQLQRKASEWHPDGWNSIWTYAFTLTEADRTS